MEKQYSVKFFSSFIESLQNICQEHLTFDQVVEVSGYVSVEIDNARKERYVLSELLQNCGNVISESYCTKVYKNLPVAVRVKNKTGETSMDDNKENTSDTSRASKSSHSDLNQSFDHSPEPKRRKSNPTPSRSPIVFHKFNTAEANKKSCEQSRLKGVDPGLVESAQRQTSSSSIGIESRSSSFLASAAKPWSAADDVHQAPGQESLQDFVSGVIDSLNSPTSGPNSISSAENSCENTFLDLPKSSKKSSKSSLSKSSTHDKPGQSLLQSTAPGSSTKKQFSLSNLFRLKSKPKKSEAKASTSKKSSTNSTSLDSPAQSQNMNISSLRHLVSKSYEGIEKLEQRKVGMESDIPPGQAYIEVLEEGKEEDDEDGEIISLEDHEDADDADVEAVTERNSSFSAATALVSGTELPCTVSSSLMLEAGSISTVTSMDDVDSSQLGMSEEDAPEENLDSPIIIDLDSEDEGEEEDSAQPYSSVEIRKLDTFKDYVKFAVKRFQTFTREKGICEPIFQIPPKKLDPLLAEFYVTVRNKRGEEFGISTLKSIQSYLELYLRENGYPVSITRDDEFSHCRSMLRTKIQQLREIHMESRPSQSASVTPLTRRDVDKLFRTQRLGDATADSLTNSMWFMNSALFKLNQNVVHCSLKWGDFLIKVDEYQNEYLELSKSSILNRDHTNCKVLPNNANPERCFVRLFKQFERIRPASTLTKNSPFYLTVDRQLNALKNEKMNSPAVSVILRNMLIHVGIQSDKQITEYDIL